MSKVAQLRHKGGERFFKPLDADNVEAKSIPRGPSKALFTLEVDIEVDIVLGAFGGIWSLGMQAGSRLNTGKRRVAPCLSRR
jgi:hypothetical protein